MHVECAMDAEFPDLVAVPRPCLLTVRKTSAKSGCEENSCPDCGEFFNVVVVIFLFFAGAGLAPALFVLRATVRLARTSSFLVEADLRTRPIIIQG